MPEEERVDAAAHPVDVLAHARDSLAAAGKEGARRDEQCRQTYDFHEVTSVRNEKAISLMIPNVTQV